MERQLGMDTILSRLLLGYRNRLYLSLMASEHANLYERKSCARW